MKVVVLGGSGMLGSMVVDVLSRDYAFKVTATVRTEALRRKCGEKIPSADWRLFDADDLSSELDVIDGADWVINAIGITKPLIHDDNPVEVERAIRINALLPYRIADRTKTRGAHVLQIATDCVYSGERGGYTENDIHDAFDVYGKTKSMGEVGSDHVYHLRCSIVGPEPKEHKFLLDWFLRQIRNASVNGYTNHLWNGITTLHFSKLAHAVITGRVAMPHLHHAIPKGQISKYELLRCFGERFDREDVTIIPVKAGQVVDRTLVTENPDVNVALWSAAGYMEPPDIPAMIAELAAYDYRFEGGLQ